MGVLAVDPTSPFTGGAILGDRIRMQAHATDPGVFIRSLATRGTLGGLSRATGDCIRVMDAMGKDVIVVETVGVGQDEIDIAQMAHTTCVVAVPGMGDDIQAIKAGILEVADVFVVNKADLDGADRTVRELRQMLELRHAVRRPPMDHDAPPPLKIRAAGQARARAPSADEWEPPILKVVAARTRGWTRWWRPSPQHREFLERTGQRAERERARARMQFVALLARAAPAQSRPRPTRAREGPAGRGRARHRPPRGGPVRARRDLARQLAQLTDARPRPPHRCAALEGLCSRLGWTRWTRGRALAALTHKSYVNEHRDEGADNERLEFLGDAVVDLAVSHRLMERFPGADEGELSKLRALLVNEEGLARVARQLGLGDLLRLGRGEELTGGRDKSSVLADALEAVIGAVYLSTGLPGAVIGWWTGYFGDALEGVAEGQSGEDYKTRLQEQVQTRLQLVAALPRGEPRRAPTTPRSSRWRSPSAPSCTPGPRGRSKKEAEQAAAREGAGPGRRPWHA